MFSKRFWLEAGKDFATSFITGMLVYVVSDGDLGLSALFAAGVGTARAAGGVLVPRFLKARDEEVGEE